MLLARLLHVIGFIALVGGQLTLIFAVVPATQKFGAAPELMKTVGRRFGIVAAAGLAMIVASGIWMSGHLSLWSSDLLHVKLMLVVLMVVLVGMHIATPRARAVVWINLIVSLIVVWLGLRLAWGG